MRRIGLTGSMAMGKSTTASMARRMGVRVWDADRAVHTLYARGGGAAAPIAAAFPGAVREGAVDRAALRRHLEADPDALPRLEAIIHPLVRASQRRFAGWARRQRLKRVLFDIPLLFETGQQRRFDAILVASAPRRLQRQRILDRPGMTRATVNLLLARQRPDGEKRRQADTVIRTGLGRHLAWTDLARSLRRFG